MAPRISLTVLVTALALANYGCGGGGGSSSSNNGDSATSGTLSGTAATGAALSGTVRITDAKGTTRQVSTGVNGTYSIETSGLTAPFVLMVEATVDGKTRQYYAPAVSEDINKTVNITPLSDLVLSQVTKDWSENCAKSTPCIASLTKSAIDTQVSSLKTRLAPTLNSLGLDAETDPLHTAFTGGSGMGVDALLDVLRIESGCFIKGTTCVDRNIITISDVVSGTYVLDDLQTDVDDSTLLNSTQAKEHYAIHLAIRARLTEMDAIAASADSEADKAVKLQGFCTSDFLWHGTSCSDFAQWAATWRNWVGRLDRIGRFDATGVDNIDPLGALDDQHVGVVSKDYGRSTTLWRKNTADGKYYLAGDLAAGRFLLWADHFWDALSATGSSYLMAQIVPSWDGTAIADTVTISGPGLGGGMTYSLTDLGLNGDTVEIPVNGTLSAAIQTELNDQSYYTFTLTKNGTVVGTHKRSLQDAPLDPGTLTASLFTSVTNPPALALCNTGGTWTPNYNRNGRSVISTQLQCRDGYIYDSTTTVDNKEAGTFSVTKTWFTSRFLTTRIVSEDNGSGLRFTWTSEATQ